MVIWLWSMYSCPVRSLFRIYYNALLLKWTPGALLCVMSVFRIFLCQRTSVGPHSLPLRPARRRAVTPLSNDNSSVEMNRAGPSLCQLKAPRRVPRGICHHLLIGCYPSNGYLPCHRLRERLSFCRINGPGGLQGLTFTLQLNAEY